MVRSNPQVLVSAKAQSKSMQIRPLMTMAPLLATILESAVAQINRRRKPWRAPGDGRSLAQSSTEALDGPRIGRGEGVMYFADEAIKEQAVIGQKIQRI